MNLFRTFAIVVFIFLVEFANSQCSRIQDSLELIEIYNRLDGDNWHVPWDFQQPLDKWHGVQLYTRKLAPILLVNDPPPPPDRCEELIFIYSGQTEIIIDSLIISNTFGSELGPYVTGNTNVFENNFCLKTVSSGDTVPSNSVMLIQTSAIGEHIYDLENICEQFQDVYIFASDNTSCGGGYFVNLDCQLYTLSYQDYQLQFSNYGFCDYWGINYFCEHKDSIEVIPSLDTSFHDCVRSLNLAGNNLTGDLPDFNLNNCEFIDFSNNSISSIAEFEGFSSLLTIDFSGNLIDDDISQINQIEYSCSLDLSFNSLTGCFTDSIINCNSSANPLYLENPFLPWNGDISIYCDSLYSFNAPCNDLNSETENDYINSECICEGILTSTIGINSQREPNLFNYSNQNFHVTPNHQVTEIISLATAKVKFNQIDNFIQIEDNLVPGIYIVMVKNITSQKINVVKLFVPY